MVQVNVSSLVHFNLYNIVQINSPYMIDFLIVLIISKVVSLFS